MNALILDVMGADGDRQLNEGVKSCSKCIYYGMHSGCTPLKKILVFYL